MTRLELAEQAAALRARGLFGHQIAAELGISRSYAHDLLNDPTGEAGKRRKAAYAGACIGCGKATTGCNGRDAAPTWCRDCLPGLKRLWTHDNVIEALQTFYAAHGRGPVAGEYGHEGLPSAATVMKRFAGRLNNALDAAGIEHHPVGGYRRSGRQDPAILAEKAISELRSIADADGVLPYGWRRLYSSLDTRLALYVEERGAALYARAGVRLPPHRGGGGQPRRIDYAEAKRLHGRGLTYGQIAYRLGCSAPGARRAVLS